MKKYILIILIVLLFTELFSQTGNLKGSILHGIINEPSPFITVELFKDTLEVKKEQADEFGCFEFKDLLVGEYNLTLSFIDYQPHITTEFAIFNDSTTVLNLKYPCQAGKYKSKRICPHGHRDNIVGIAYGEPTGRTLRRILRGKLMSGGCTVTDCNPKWYCKTHKIEF